MLGDQPCQLSSLRAVALLSSPRSPVLGRVWCPKSMGLFPPGQRTQHQPQSSSRGRSLGLVPEQPPLSELHLGPEGGQGTGWKHRWQGVCWVEASFHCLQVTGFPDGRDLRPYQGSLWFSPFNKGPLD